MALIDTAEIGSKGGKARAKNMTKEQRSQSAREAANARWAGKNAEVKATKKAKKKSAR